MKKDVRCAGSRKRRQTRERPTVGEAGGTVLGEASRPPMQALQALGFMSILMNEFGEFF